MVIPICVRKYEYVVTVIFLYYQRYVMLSPNTITATMIFSLRQKRTIQARTWMETKHSHKSSTVTTQPSGNPSSDRPSEADAVHRQRPWPHSFLSWWISSQQHYYIRAPVAKSADNRKATKTSRRGCHERNSCKSTSTPIIRALSQVFRAKQK